MQANISSLSQQFQKDAIYRQMQEFKRERNALETRLNDMSKRATFHDDHLRIIDAWFKQVCSRVCAILGIYR